MKTFLKYFIGILAFIGAVVLDSYFIISAFSCSWHWIGAAVLTAAIPAALIALGER